METSLILKNIVFLKNSFKLHQHILAIKSRDQMRLNQDNFLKLSLLVNTIEGSRWSRQEYYTENTYAGTTFLNTK